MSLHVVIPQHDIAWRREIRLRRVVVMSSRKGRDSLKQEVRELKRWITYCCQWLEPVVIECWPMSRRVTWLESSQFDKNAKCILKLFMTHLFLTLQKSWCLHVAWEVLWAKGFYEPSWLKYKIKFLSPLLIHKTLWFQSSKELLFLFNA